MTLCLLDSGCHGDDNGRNMARRSPRGPPVAIDLSSIHWSSNPGDEDPLVTESSEHVLELLRNDGDFAFYRGRLNSNPAPVLAVTLASELTLPQSLRRLEYEYSLAEELDSSWAVTPLALTRHAGRPTLVLKDPGGEPLDRILERQYGQPLELTRVLRIAIGLATALAQVHRHGLIHKDIKPANVLADEAGNVWLTGFGIASRLPHERQSPEPPEIIAGTLAYMAPEQTGRMNRSIDARSDLYSLGVTLYQMLTGALPFAAADPLEWVHCHIARPPTPPEERAGVPERLSAITMMLLAKNAEERYQTASGLEADLRQCLVEWEIKGRINPFPLCTHDVPNRLLIPERLYGRKQEVDALLAAFDRVLADGRPELVLVSGYSGIGKSSVVNELHRALVPARGLFAAGKFDQFRRNIPYATLAEAFQTLVRQILVKSEAEVEQWRSDLREAVGPNGQLMVSLIPGLEFILGKQPPVPELSPRDAQNRFQLVFRRFLGVFARPEHPLALFLDDLQWLDVASLELLEHLIRHSEVQHLLLVGAYRDNEVGPAHPLTRTLEAIRKAGVPVQEIVLAPLGHSDVGALVSDALHCRPDRAGRLAELVQEKTVGNPFFAIQFLTALADEGLLAFDPVTRAWQWDISRIRAKSYTDNVVDLMSRKLRRLSAPTQEALKLLASLGNVAEVATLALVHGETEEAMHADLQEAVGAGLIFPENCSYKFLHDRIREAAYSLIPDEHRAEAHLNIGRVLLASLTEEELTEHLFEVANQFHQGAALLTDREEKAHVATIDLRAGRKAKASAAYASAQAYFSDGMALLDEEDWSIQYELTFSLWLERAECEYLSGNFENVEPLLGELLRRGASKIDQAAVHCLKIQFHVVRSENQQAVASGLACLRLFGIDLPEHPTWEQVLAEYETVWQSLDGRPIESLIDLPLMTDPELLAAIQVLSSLAPAAYHTDHCLACIRVCHMVKVSIEHGISDGSASAYGSLGTMLGPVFHRYPEALRFAKLAGDLVEKHGFIASRGKVHFAMGRAAFWTQPIATAIDFMRTSLRGALETGELTLACYGMSNCIAGLLLRNDPLDAVWRESETALDFARESRYGDGVDVILSQQRFIANMQGRTAGFSTFSDAQFDEAAFETELIRHRLDYTNCRYWILKLKARFLSGDYAEALAAAGKVLPIPSAAIGQIHLLDYFYYSALAVAACYENATAGEQARWRGLLAEHREQLREWAENYPPTFVDKYSLVLAEIARLEGRDSDAMRLYEQAIRSALESGFVQNEGLAQEVAARFYAARGFDTIAQAYLRNARKCYERWGAFGKVKQLDELYPGLHEERVSSATTPTIGTPVRQLDAETVVKASQALSSEIVLSRLIERLMRIVVEHAAAERGLLILLRGDEPRIEAEAITGDGRVEVNVRQIAITPGSLPQSALHYVIRTRERVVLDDASVDDLYSGDEYVRQMHPRSVLCLPIVQQTKLIGAVYLENNLTPRAFTSDRVALLEMLASQAAISLENARLYSDLQRSEAYLVQGQSISQTGSFGRSISSGEIFWSEETYRIFEYDRSLKPTLDSVIQRIHPDDVDYVRQTIDRANRERTDFDIEYRLLRPDGSVKHLHVIARASSPSSDELEFVGTVMDVTAAKEAEETLRESTAYLAEAQRLSHTGSWARTSATGDIRYWSEECYRVLGFDPHGGLPRFETFFERIHPDDQPRAAETFERAQRERAEFEADFRIVHLGGEIRDIHAVGHPVLAPSGELLELVGTVIDVTERKRAEAERERLRQAQADLARVNRATTMGELTASLAHEVTQPIAAAVTDARTCMRWLELDEPDLAEARAAAARMVKDGKLAGEIISRIRSQFRKEAAKRDLVDVNEAIRETIAMLGSEAMRYDISVRTELAADLPQTMGDRVQLQQVMMNLIINSIDAMKEVDGTHEITLKSQIVENEQLQVTVSDTGIGLPPQQAEQIFNAFYTTKSHGTGMGLRISRSIIESHGGRLWAAEVSGRGATFQFTLPVMAAAQTISPITLAS
jgi:PAS domain S-box-containing protein